ncbi:hypothetical protein RD110_21950 [Rhodoferax koreense]|uniref:Uncharacterized protein n=1 Tax=Rhodoferax koreensis TaxID=1842727 RepID=A0A1P8K0L3_9BURK|nr:hypothetical protein RD110_21950 [Rhodoferax koreense]
MSTPKKSPKSMPSPLQRLSAEAIDRFVREQVPLLTQKYLEEHFPARPAQLPEWFVTSFSEVLEQHCRQYMRRHLQTLVKTEVEKAFAPFEENIYQQLTKQLPPLIRAAMTQGKTTSNPTSS